MTKSTTLELSTSRISRLLRPLRLKCNVLATSASVSTPKVNLSAASTSSGHSLHPDYDKPLAIIPSPKTLRTLSKVDRASRANMEISKMLYDVRDAFMNLLRAISVPEASESPSGRATTPQRGRIPRLSSLCAAVLGEYVEEQVDLAKAERRDEDVSVNGDLDVMYNFYEVVPSHHRRSMVISHALSIILSTCPRNHTLYYILLEVTMLYGLYAESQTVLYHILQVAITPEMTSSLREERPVSPVTLPSHSNYLESLRDKVAVAGLINDRAFAGILCSVLGPITSAWHEIWTCRAMVRLARRFRSQDYEAFIYLCHQLSGGLATFSCSAKGKEREDPSRVKVCDRLAKWLEVLCERLATTCEVQGATKGSGEELMAIVDLLCAAETSRLHLSMDHTDASKAIANALLCLAVLCVSSPHHTTIPAIPMRSLVGIMRDYHGTNIDTFNPITIAPLSLIDQAGDLCQLLLHLNAARTLLNRWASILRAERLFLLEAWLWSNVLAHVEAMGPEFGSHNDIAIHHDGFVDELEKLRKEIVKKIEEAENMHFSDGRPTTFSVDQTPSKAASKARGSEFRWEEIIECWVMKTPLPVKSLRTLKRSYVSQSGEPEEEYLSALGEHISKRPRTAFGTPSPPRISSDMGSISSASYVSSWSSTMLASSSPMTSSFGEPENVENQPTPVQLGPQKARNRRRRSTFTSILGDANSNRVVLHGKATEDRINDWNAESAEPLTLPLRDIVSRSSPKTPTRAPHNEDPSSDDLDLFAYRSSEW